MNKVNNTFRSKVMKAAWTSFRKGGKSFSQALVKAWKWAKETLLKDFNVWSPRPDMFRAYFGENAYVQVNVKERRPFGSYEQHRSCKGETFATAWYKLVNVTEEQLNMVINGVMMPATCDWKESKF